MVKDIIAGDLIVQQLDNGQYSCSGLMIKLN